MVRPAEQHANPQVQVDALAELLLAPSDRRLRQSVLTVEPENARLKSSALPRHPQGQILRTIKAVLENHPSGLAAKEIHHLVEQQLRRPVRLHTVRAALADHPNNFERLKRGWYRLRT